MEEIKFTCPSCSQRVACEASHAGENFPCPSCATMVRVPMVSEYEAPSAGNAENPFAPAPVARKEEPPMATKPPEVTKLSEQQFTGKPTEVPTAEEIANWHRGGEWQCVCPVCQAELRITLATAPKLEKRQLESWEQVTAGEREEQIAAARDSQQISLHPNVKPRLDKILGDGDQQKAA
jgi:hypothetical protein